jgi:hypothetical protein
LLKTPISSKDLARMKQRTSNEGAISSKQPASG